MDMYDSRITKNQEKKIGNDFLLLAVLGLVAILVVSTLPATQADSAEPTPSALMAERFGGAAVWTGDVAYYFGGFHGGAYSDHVIRYDRATGDTSLAGLLPEPMAGMGVAWSGQHAYLIGGITPTGYRDTILQWNPATGTTTTMASKLPEAMAVYGIAWDGSTAFALGGETCPFPGITVLYCMLPGSAYNRVLEYTPSTDTLTITDATLVDSGGFGTYGVDPVWAGDRVLFPMYDGIYQYQGGTVSQASNHAFTNPWGFFWDGSYLYATGEGRLDGLFITDGTGAIPKQAVESESIQRWDPDTDTVVEMPSSVSGWAPEALWTGDEAILMGSIYPYQNPSLSRPTTALGIEHYNPYPGTLSVSSPTHPASEYGGAEFVASWLPDAWEHGVAGYSYALAFGTATPNVDKVMDVDAATRSAALPVSGFGAYTIGVRIVDELGQAGPVTSHAFLADAVPPTVDSRDPDDGQVVSAEELQLVVRWSDTDNGDDPEPSLTRVDPASVRLFVNGVDTTVCRVQVGCSLTVTGGGLTYEPVAWDAGVQDAYLEFSDEAGNQARSSWSFRVTTPVDADGDRVPDEIESQLCSRELVRDVVLATSELGHACNASSFDYTPPTEHVNLDVPVEARLGVDGDGDGVPRDVTLRQVKLVFDPDAGIPASLEPTESRVEILDEDDADATNPVDAVAQTDPFPVGFLLGPDGDDDGFIESIQLEMAYLRFDGNGHVPLLAVEDAGLMPVVVDEDDEDEDVPVEDNLQLPVPIPWVTSDLEDEDEDGLPSEMEVGLLHITVHRQTWFKPVPLVDYSIQATPVTTVFIDPDDADPENPLRYEVVTLSVPIDANHGGDADGDGVPASVTVTYMDVTVDRRGIGFWGFASHSETTQLDPDDEDADEPVPFSVVDADHDRVPDAAESWFCQVEHQGDDSDGSCDGDDYTPPEGTP